MTMVKMTEKEMEDLSICRDCRHFHRYKARHTIRDVYVEDGRVGVEDRTHTLRRCLVGGTSSPPLEEKVVVDCNQFERREEKKKL